MTLITKTASPSCDAAATIYRPAPTAKASISRTQDRLAPPPAVTLETASGIGGDAAAATPISQGSADQRPAAPTTSAATASTRMERPGFITDVLRSVGSQPYEPAVSCLHFSGDVLRHRTQQDQCSHR